MKISVIGAGSWGTAMSKVLSDSGHEVLLWVREKELLELLNEQRRSYYIEDLTLPEGIRFTGDIHECFEFSNLLFNAVPVQYIRSVFGRLNLEDKTVVNLSKGIELVSLKRPSEIFKELGTFRVVTISGPSYADEVAREIPTTVVSAAENIQDARFVRDIFRTNYFRVYSSDDLVGVEISGALKNVIAIAAGIIDGLGGWYNTKASLITRATVEFIRLGSRLGAKPGTFGGLAGIGDLIVTCTGKYSRNRAVGEELAKGKKIEEILKNKKTVAEGVPTCKAIFELSKRLNVELPISIEVYRVIYEEKDPRIAIEELMTRKQKDEISWLQNL
ncbi:NAD(P)H-dependent glycerol-3-phosphate dehydrogenase [Kosmotoga pacifica]|uniref:Glycerol-3-phosphate dehydrogenase [NAD(P)+] n=1 Tax=Kosmotoga pacifica TaxID=1330330 RepID=A0A0G2Z4K1_9BACT|nr:NAD(P)H-dependent glycerol-3-phosphate dehydrogenase [Kosmotoga pacifica]AKI96477.1 glycerol-3-phosphate dehydrogenase [Kosmotoga pacifica]